MKTSIRTITLPKFVRKLELYQDMKYFARDRKEAAHFLALAVVPGYRPASRWYRRTGRHQITRLKYAVLESRPAMWWAANKHRPGILWGLLAWVNVYEVERCYGGPEEGGWWYDAYVPIESKRVLRKNAIGHREHMQEEFGGLAWGDISSVCGGMEIDVRIEDTRGEMPTRPHYA